MDKNLIVGRMMAVGKAVASQTTAQDKTADARHDLACAMFEDGVNLNDKTQDAEFKLELQKAYPKGTGKAADPKQKKQVQAIRQICATYKKAGKDVSPRSFETYSQYRNAVYGDQSKTPLDQIKNWIDKDKITTEDIQELLNSYKAILDIAA